MPHQTLRQRPGPNEQKFNGGASSSAESKYDNRPTLPTRSPKAPEKGGGTLVTVLTRIVLLGLLGGAGYLGYDHYVATTAAGGSSSAAAPKSILSQGLKNIKLRATRKFRPMTLGPNDVVLFLSLPRGGAGMRHFLKDVAQIEKIRICEIDSTDWANSMTALATHKNEKKSLCSCQIVIPKRTNAFHRVHWDGVKHLTAQRAKHCPGSAGRVVAAVHMEGAHPLEAMLGEKELEDNQQAINFDDAEARLRDLAFLGRNDRFHESCCLFARTFGHYATFNKLCDPKTGRVTKYYVHPALNGGRVVWGEEAFKEPEPDTEVDKKLHVVSKSEFAGRIEQSQTHVIPAKSE